MVAISFSVFRDKLENGQKHRNIVLTNVLLNIKKEQEFTKEKTTLTGKTHGQQKPVRSATNYLIIIHLLDHILQNIVRKIGKMRIQKGLSKGKNNPSWKGGITPLMKQIRNSEEYGFWRKAVYVKDNYSCQRCFKRGNDIVAHHLKSFANYPTLRFDVDNGLTLCVNCHKESHSKKGD